MICIIACRDENNFPGTVYFLEIRQQIFLKLHEFFKLEKKFD